MEITDELLNLLKTLHLDPKLFNNEEIQVGLDIISFAKNNPRVKDTVICLFEKGPVFDGDLPSKDDFWKLFDEDYAAKIIVKTESDYNALTYKGHMLYKIFIEIEIN